MIQRSNMNIKRFSKLTIVLAAFAALSGCSNWNKPSEWLNVDFGENSFLQRLSVYRPDVQQGNLITSEMLSELRIGMNQSQVQFLLGVPLLKDEFHQKRWDYLYYTNPRIGKPSTRRLTCFFDDEGRLEKYEFTDLPTETDADKSIIESKPLPASSSDKVTVVTDKTAGP